MASLNISDQEHEERLLAVTLQPIFVEACIACATAAILLFMCIYGLSVHLETPKELRQSRRVYVAISFILLVIHSFRELPYTYYIFQLLYKTSNWRQVYSFRDELEDTWWMHASDLAINPLMWLGDGLLVYRCHIVWTGRPLVIAFPATLYLAAIGVSIFEKAALLSGHGSPSAYSAWICLSVGVNCIVTFLISWRLLRMRKQQEAVMAPIDTKIYIGVVSILVESALPLALSGIALVVSTEAAKVPTVQSKTISIVHNIVVIVWVNISVLAPALIIFRVAAGRSWAHSTREASHLSTLAFQPRSSHSSGEIGDSILAAPLDNDIEKNESVFSIRNQVPGSHLGATEGSSSLRPHVRRRGSI